jgi:hypothetical protein
MSFGNLYHDDPAHHRSSRGSSKGISSLLALVLTIFGAGFYLQSTLAANVSLNSGGAIEFGQGSARTVACSEGQSLIITPFSSFTNSAGAGSHKFKSIKVTNIPTACQGQDFTFSAYNNVANSAAQAIFNTSSTRAVVYMKDDDTFEVGIGGTGLSVTTNSASSFTVTFTTPVVTSSAVFNLTVESAAHTVRPCSDGGACAIGETGPGGGAVFYIASTQQSWGRYLEAAPKTWNAGTEDPLLAWCNTRGSWVGGTASRQTQDIFGAGPANTALMISGCTSGAGVSVGSYNSSGRSPVSDWYLPTLVESNELCKFAYNVSDNNPAIACTTAFGGGVRTLRSDFLAAIYYTSYEETENYARYRRLDVNNVGGVAGHLKTDSLRVRPIRAF